MTIGIISYGGVMLVYGGDHAQQRHDVTVYPWGENMGALWE